jgi:hypothetical protein
LLTNFTTPPQVAYSQLITGISSSQRTGKQFPRVFSSRTVREHFSHGFFLPAPCESIFPMGFFFPHGAGAFFPWVLAGAPVSTTLTTKYFYYEKKVIGTSF